jgi:hypothetical protein
MKTLFMTAILALSFSSLSSFADESKAATEICFNNSRTKGKDVKVIKKKAKKSKAVTVKIND